MWKEVLASGRYYGNKPRSGAPNAFWRPYTFAFLGYFLWQKIAGSGAF